MRRGFGFLGLIATAIVLAIVGVVAYNIGWSDGASTHFPAGVAAAPYYYYGPHFWGAGFGIFGVLWFLFVLFVLFAVIRFVFFGRRMMGGWGYGRGFYGHGRGPGHAMPPGIEERMQEWHRRAHGETPPADAGATPPPPPDQRAV